MYAESVRASQTLNTKTDKIQNKTPMHLINAIGVFIFGNMQQKITEADNSASVLIMFRNIKSVVKAALYKCYQTLNSFFLVGTVSDNTNIGSAHNAE